MAYETPDAGKGDQRLFEEAPLAVRAAITVAGPIANFGFTVFVFALVFCLWGQRVRTAEITRIIPDTPAEAAGLQPGDRFLTIDGNRIERFDDALDLIHAHPGDRLAVVVQRGAARKTLEITPRILAVPSGDAPTAYESGIGIRYDFRDIYIRRAPLEALLRASRATTDNIASTLSGLRQLVEHKRPADQVGGIGSFVIVGHKTAANGPEALMWLAGLLSISIGLFNLFPIPILDGGHLMFLAYEALTRRKPSPRVVAAATLAGIGVILSLALFGAGNDLRHSHLAALTRPPS